MDNSKKATETNQVRALPKPETKPRQASHAGKHLSPTVETLTAIYFSLQEYELPLVGAGFNLGRDGQGCEIKESENAELGI